MGGIRYPRNWKEIIENNEVIEKRLMIFHCNSLKTELEKQLKNCVFDVFQDTDFCIALSGGIDSSVLTVLLRNCLGLGVVFNIVTIGSSMNHPDIIHATGLAKEKEWMLVHKIKILTPPRRSDDAYDDLFAAIAEFGFKNAICADTVDEMLGGYQAHIRSPRNRLYQVFECLWKELLTKHLKPMDYYAKKYDINVGLPYLGAHNLLCRVDMSQRIKSGQGKIILRQLAKKLEIPESIINRRKYGLCSVWEEFNQ